MFKNIFAEIIQNNTQLVHVHPIIPDSYSFFIAQISKISNRLLFVVKDDTQLEVIAKQIEFFNENKKVIIFPSWECSPYDKISPNISNLAKRIEALVTMISLKENFIVLTSIDSLVQKLIPMDFLKQHIVNLKIGDIFGREEILSILSVLGYRRVEVASEPGDFAVRGDIIDIVANMNAWRINFLGNQVEQIRIFDPFTQISSSKIESLQLLPSGEVILNETTIANFCTKFKEHLENFANDHPLYQAIHEGRRYPGMEHFLPFFYKTLNNIFDYIKPDFIVCEHSLWFDIETSQTEINEYYQARKTNLTHRFQDEVLYYPIDPQSLWLTSVEIKKIINENKLIMLHEFSINLQNDIEMNLKKGENFDFLAKNKQISAFDLFKKYRENNKRKTIILCNSEGSLNRIKTILDNYNIHWYVLKNFADYKNITGKTVGLAILAMNHGYSFDDFAIVTEQDLLGEKIIRKKSTKSIEHLVEELNNLQIGEYVVHKQHGIGLFSGLENIKAAGIEHDCIKILYDANDILYIPVENLDLLTRYGSSDEEVKLDKLGGISWENRKNKLRAKLKEIAKELINTAALRSNREGEYLEPATDKYEEFCKKFPYIETEDQHNSINDVITDLSSGTPMDRLICGDVGFGKTEVAMRAAFIATHPKNNAKQQVAIVVPTTLLARQHYHAFVKRFDGLSIKIRQLSRLIKSSEASKIKEEIKNGEVDIIIGTHSLLAKNVEFKNLGLLIIDEEQRFGVAQKEKLKIGKENIHILTLSATPIPRTLQMSLTGVRDLSIIATPPIDRQVIKTYIMNYDSVIIREAILREFYRGGQIFFVCPRIGDLEEILPKLRELVPEIKIVVAHGKMSPAALEEIMSDFYNKKFQLLLSTSIVESGIDIAEANTMIIYRADKFGLSALYQLRGRVGRSNIKAFAYLLLPNKKLSKLAMSRLEVMQTLDTLGAGFTVATHDMDIRGFGNLVGDQQSGHIKEVGLELYQEMLQEAISSLKNSLVDEEKIEDDYSPQINLGITVILPDDYIADLHLRLSLYRKLASFNNIEQVDFFAVELIDRFGKYPEEVSNLLEIIKLKIKSKQLNIEKIEAGPKAITLAFKNNHPKYPEQTFNFVEKNQAFVKIRADHKLLINKEFITIQEKIKFITELLNKLSDITN